MTSTRLTKLLHHLSSSNSTYGHHHHIKPSNTINITTSAKLSKIYPNVSSELKSILGDRYTEDDSILIKHGREVIGYARSNPPSAVVFPSNIDEVVAVTKICHNNLIAIIPYAAGSSLESHILQNVTPLKDYPSITITLSFAKMNKLLAIHAEDMQCTVEPGLNWVKLNESLLSYNLFLGVDPAPAACIGGMIGTSCSGPSALRYGTMRNQIISMKVVLSNGTILKTGQRAIKSVAGYDLNSLFSGSEGTLGIIVEATLRLRSLPKYTEIAQASFDDLESIGFCVEEINASGVNLAAFEFIDDQFVVCCKKYDKKVDLILNKQLIMFKFCGPSKEHIAADIKLISNIVCKYTKYPFKFSKNEEERHRLWKVRKMAFWAGKFANPGKEVFVTDVAVPFSNFNQSLIQCKKEFDKSWLNCPIIGHIGDGNWHSCIFFDKSKEKDVAEAERLNNFIVKNALLLEGTCTAEHGVGKHKKKWLKYEFGQNTVDFMKSLKRFIDPKCILNPGNIVE